MSDIRCMKYLSLQQRYFLYFDIKAEVETTAKNLSHKTFNI